MSHVTTQKLYFCVVLLNKLISSEMREVVRAEEETLL